jgi:50S ribosomal protein L16 3-hydroxylase
MPDTSRMRMPRKLSAKQFLADYWQKQSLFMPAALEQVAPALSADELAWLATLPDVESRLVFTERTGGNISYRLEQGPFAESELQSLPETDWTLLVQDVDKHLPDFRAWFAHVNFIPGWRIDDLMVSFAAPGGSVGPHLDQYDVFLCQGQGHREWRIGDPETAEQDERSTGLSLLQAFAATGTHAAAQGDVLYLPPGIPHWGIATDLCMTYSIGFRAPTKPELQAGAARVLTPEAVDLIAPHESDAFYADPDLSVDEATYGQISQQSIRRIREQALLDESLSDMDIARILGSVVTDPKAWLLPDAADPEFAIGNNELLVHGMTRLAWYAHESSRLAFANGLAAEVPAECLGLMQELTAARAARSSSIRESCASGRGREFLNWLLEQGVFDAGHSAE